LVSREINGTDAAALTIGAIHGGEGYNIIPETVVMKGALRCLDEEKRDYFEKRLVAICNGISETMRAKCIIEFEKGYPVTYNDPNETRFVMDCAKKLFGENKVHLLDKPLMMSEDMSIFLQKCPGFYWLISTPAPGTEMYANHNPYFTIDESLLHMGSALMAQTAFDWLNKNRS
ncbi:MAG: M20/M25/M40 family metallo-hydrolase, partial [Clostridiales bacterium]|nr:M20/M25/M40 family metallo-hydrolase [Clostridiales bacterium]